MVRHVEEMKISTSPQRAALPFVGRGDELGRVVAALDHALQGKGGTILLAGQPGIGKTRLAREAIALARGQGFAALDGRAHPLEIGLAYAPIIEAFGPLLGSFDSSYLADLTSDLPSLGRLFEGLRLPMPEPLGDPTLEKTRLFEAVARLLQRLTRQTPVALFLDDLQWADPATLELSYYLMRGLSDQRALVLASYASDALDSAHGLRELVGSLQRDGLAVEIAISRLDPDEVDRLIRASLGGEAPAELLPLLEARAKGVPLYVEALIVALIESGNLTRRGGGWSLDAEGAKTLPQSIRRLILQRLARLAPTDRHILDLISIIGGAASHTTLQAASGLSEDTLIGALQRLQVAGLVAEQIDGTEVFYGITHPLVRDVAYGDLPEMARRRIHLAAIEALESVSKGRPDDLAGLARHYRAAGPGVDRGRALAALIAAGDRALATYANEEAARHYDTALAMVREGGEESASTLHPQLSTLLERLGDARERIGKRGAAMDAWQEALVLLSEGGCPLGAAGDAVAASRLRHRLSLAEWDQGQFNTASEHLRAGLAALAHHDPCQELVDLHYARFSFLSRLGDLSGMADATAELLAVARRLESPRAEAEANIAASLYEMERRDIGSARKRAAYALTVAEQARELMACYKAQTRLTAVDMCLGDHRRMRYHAECGLAVAQRLGSPNLEILLRQRLAYADFLAGAWDESNRTSIEAISLARQVGNPRDLAYLLASHALLLVFRGDLSEAAVRIHEIRTTFGGPSEGRIVDGYVFGFVDNAEMALALERGQVERALGLAGRLISSLALGLSGTVPGAAGLTPYYHLPVGLMLLAEAQMAAGIPRSALETAQKLMSLGPTDSLYPIALASRAEGLVRKALGQPEDAVARLTDASEKFTALDMPFEAARALLERGVSAPPAKREQARRDARESVGIFERLGARRYADRARRLLAELDGPSAGTRLDSHFKSHLRGRELEIAQLVADGLKTTEIAQRLVLSPHTVTSHLHHIYARFGVSSRASLVRHMIEAGLVELNNQNR